MAEKLRVGVFGAGRWARMAHVPGWQRDPRCEVVVVCDPVGDLARPHRGFRRCGEFMDPRSACHLEPDRHARHRSLRRRARWASISSRGTSTCARGGRFMRV